MTDRFFEKQLFCHVTLVIAPACVLSRHAEDQRLVKRCEFVGRLLAPVGRLVHLVGAPNPLAYRVARKACGPGYFVQRFLIA